MPHLAGLRNLGLVVAWFGPPPTSAIIMNLTIEQRSSATRSVVRPEARVIRDGFPSDQEWSPTDAAAAATEGWGLFECPGSVYGRCQLQQIDDMQIFHGDADAHVHVFACAATGSPLHRKAVWLLALYNSSEYLRFAGESIPVIKATAKFRAQAWIDDYAVDVDPMGDDKFDVTAQVRSGSWSARNRAERRGDLVIARTPNDRRVTLAKARDVGRSLNAAQAPLRLDAETVGWIEPKAIAGGQIRQE